MYRQTTQTCPCSVYTCVINAFVYSSLLTFLTVFVLVLYLSVMSFIRQLIIGLYVAYVHANRDIDINTMTVQLVRLYKIISIARLYDA